MRPQIMKPEDVLLYEQFEHERDHRSEDWRRRLINDAVRRGEEYDREQKRTQLKRLVFAVSLLILGGAILTFAVWPL